jgi:hypothetical protein
MGLVLSTLIDPVFQKLFLCFRKFLVRITRGHDQLRIGRKDALDEFALGSVSWLEGSGTDGLIAKVESQISLPVLRIGPVAIEAVFRQQWSDISIEFDALSRSERGNQAKKAACQ